MCALLTADEVTVATGTVMKISSAVGPNCVWSDLADPNVGVFVTLLPNAPSLEAVKQAETANHGVHVAGVGDCVFWVAARNVLFVEKGGRACSIIMVSKSPPEADPSPELIAAERL